MFRPDHVVIMPNALRETLELINGCGVVAELMFLGWMGRYLMREHDKRALTFRKWANGQLPPSMNFGIAVFVFDISVWLKSLVIWTWLSFFNSSPFGITQFVLLGIGGAGIVLGSLCKIRSVTNPDFGKRIWYRRPWIRALALIVLFAVATIVLRW